MNAVAILCRRCCMLIAALCMMKAHTACIISHVPYNALTIMTPCWCCTSSLHALCLSSGADAPAARGGVAVTCHAHLGPSCTRQMEAPKMGSGVLEFNFVCTHASVALTLTLTALMGMEARRRLFALACDSVHFETTPLCLTCKTGLDSHFC